MDIKFTNKIPQWAIKQNMLGACQSKIASQRDPELVPNPDLVEALKRTGLKPKTASQIEEDVKIMSSISPTLKTFLPKTDIKRASANSNDPKERREAIENTINKSSRGDMTGSMKSGTVRPILSGDYLLSETHSRGQVRTAGNSESFFDNPNDVENFTMSDVSRAAIAARKQDLAKKYARTKTSEEVAEEQKSRNAGSYNEKTLMHEGSITSARTEVPEINDQFDVYKMFSHSSVKNKISKEMYNLSKEVEKRLLGKLAETVKDNSSWKEAASNEINKRVANATTSAQRSVDEFYSDQQRIKNRPSPTVDVLQAELNQREFSKRMGLKNEEFKKETIASNKQRKAKITRNLETTAKAKMEIGKVSRPTQNLAQTAAINMAEQYLKDNGIEEI